MLHQHAYTKSDGVSVLGFDPFLDLPEEVFLVLLESNRRHLITGRPIVHVWKECIQLFQTCRIVFHAGYDEAAGAGNHKGHSDD